MKIMLYLKAIFYNLKVDTVWIYACGFNKYENIDPPVNPYIQKFTLHCGKSLLLSCLNYVTLPNN